MSYRAKTILSDILISDADAAFQAVSKSQNEALREYMEGHPSECGDLVTLLECVGFTEIASEDGAITGMQYDGKYDSDIVNAIFKAIRPYVRDGSRLIFRGEDDAEWELDALRQGYRYITRATYEKLTAAREALCTYCENDECEKCVVTLLLDQAYAEAVDAGIEAED